ncbi:hypothetical protein GCM10023115_24530 [Pontixanthobacter gangjinensis]
MEIKWESDSQVGQKLIKKMPASGKYFYKNGSYKQTYDNGDIEFTIHRNGSEYTYTKFRNIDTLYAENINWIRKIDSSPEISESENEENLLDLKCKRIELKNDYQTKTFIFSPSIKIDSKKFKDYINDNRNIFAELSESIPLKYIVQNELYKMTVTVLKIHENELSTDEFKIPNLPITTVK